MNSYLDEDNYPTERTLAMISNWSYMGGYEGYKKMMEIIRSIWAYCDCGYWKQYISVDKLSGDEYTYYQISTAGWSGNESIVAAMHENKLFMANCWEQSRRGGHYLFRIKNEQ